MTQTLSEKLRIIADAIDAGETLLLVGRIYASVSAAMDMAKAAHHNVQRIPAQIKVGNRTINAPLREMPNAGGVYWWASGSGDISRQESYGSIFDLDNFNNSNMWATEADAKAYAEASLAVRKGEV